MRAGRLHLAAAYWVCCMRRALLVSWARWTAADVLLLAEACTDALRVLEELLRAVGHTLVLP